MSVVRQLFGCFSSRDDIYHHSHSFSFDVAKQQHGTDGELAGNVARRSNSNGKTPLRVRFNVPTSEVFKCANLHAALRDLLVYIVREGLKVNDLFRRPGNSSDMKCIVKQLTDGTPVIWSDYNFYTVANTAKKFLLNIPGGIFGTERELSILDTYESDDAARLATIGAQLQTLPQGARQFLVLLFGAWYLIVFGGNAPMLETACDSPKRKCAPFAVQLEAVSKSVCGSLFHTCDDPRKVDRAVDVMRTMIIHFANPVQHGDDMLDYFARVTAIDVRRPDYANALANAAPASEAPAQNLSVRISRQPSKRVANDQYLLALSSPELYEQEPSATRSLVVRAPTARFNSVRRRQLERLKNRSAWFREQQAAAVSPTALFHQRWQEALGRIEIQPVALHVTRSGPELDMGTEECSRSRDLVDEVDSTGTPASEPLRRAWLGSHQDHSAIASAERNGDSCDEPSPGARLSATGCRERPRSRRKDDNKVMDEPSSSLAVEHFDFPLASNDKQDEQWSANTVL